MQPLQPLFCLVGRHYRSGRTVRQVRGEFVASCRGCGKPMIRDLDGWRLQRPDERDTYLFPVK